MTGRNNWPPKGFRTTRPEDHDRDETMIVALPQHVIDAHKAQQKTEEISHLRRLTNWIGRIFGRS